jgi:hypothetical protein
LFTFSMNFSEFKRIQVRVIINVSSYSMLFDKSFNIKVEKGYVLMRNVKDLVEIEDFLNRLESTFHQFLHLINFASFFVDILLTIPCLRYTYLLSNF